MVASLTGLRGRDNCLEGLKGDSRFQPHGHCYLWRSDLIWLHVASDALIARIIEAARAITRLRGEVRFIATTEVEEPDKKIIDKRKWD